MDSFFSVTIIVARSSFLQIHTHPDLPPAPPPPQKKRNVQIIKPKNLGDLAAFGSLHRIG